MSATIPAVAAATGLLAVSGGGARSQVAAGAASAASRPVRRGTVTVDLDRPINRFRPDRTLGAGVDGHEQGDIRLIYTRANLRAMGSAGFGPLAYRLRTELGVEAWHWNRYGSWSDARHHQGYWTGSARPGPAFAATYGYRLPRRGDTIDQANDDGYSRLDDGSLATFWKSNPYLDPHFTHEPESAHPQWLMVELARPTPVGAVRLAWGLPYARRLSIEYLVGPDALGAGTDSADYWVPFGRASFAGHGGLQTISLGPLPRVVRFVRVVMSRSSHTAPRRSRDVRDRLGFAVRELYLGTLRRGRLLDVLRHAPDHRQTITYVSSTDPWHRAIDRDPSVEQPSFQTIARSGLLHHVPLLAPVPALYGTPADSAAEIRYLRALHVPVRRVVIGEEPDGQLVTPEDYAALYVQVARRLRRLDRRLQLGGPDYQTSLPDWVSWPHSAGGDYSWTHRFLGELARLHATDELSFFSFEWYPFDNGCAPTAPQLAAAPGLLSGVLATQREEGLPASLPKLITEYGYSSFATQDTVEMAGALLNADTVGSFLADGGTAAYMYGYEPDSLIRELPCRSWGNLILFLADGLRRILQPVATYWGARMLTQEWTQPGDRLHTMLATSGPTQSGLVTAYAVRRPDGRVALMLINKDPGESWTVRIRLHRGATEQPLPGMARVISYSAHQYRWHAIGDHGHAQPDRPPSRRAQLARRAVTLAPTSLTVVQFRP